MKRFPASGLAIAIAALDILVSGGPLPARAADGTAPAVKASPCKSRIGRTRIVRSGRRLRAAQAEIGCAQALPQLSPKRTVVVVCRPEVRLVFGNPTVAADLALEVGKLLQENAKIQVIDPQRVIAWTDSHEWNAYPEVGKALKADMVVAIDLQDFALYQSKTVCQGRASAMIAVYDCARGGKLLFEKSLQPMVYPPNVGFATSDLPEKEFRRRFIGALADRIGQHFYPRGPHVELTLGPGNSGRQTAAAKFDGPAAAVSDFLEAARVGNDVKAAAMLTKTAREKNKHFHPIPSDTALFRVGKVEYKAGDLAGAASAWTDVNADGEKETQEAVWLVRREPEGWRICGVAATVLPGRPPVQLKFEDPEEMAKRLQMLREEMDRLAQEGEPRSK